VAQLANVPLHTLDRASQAIMGMNQWVSRQAMAAAFCNSMRQKHVVSYDDGLELCEDTVLPREDTDLPLDVPELAAVRLQTLSLRACV
jgi:hypothetical protein